MNESFNMEYAALYDDIYKEKNYKSEVVYVNEVIGFHKKEQVKSIIDVGCGTGNHIYYLNKLYNYNVAGVDKSSSMLQYAKGKYPFLFLHSDELIENPIFDVAISLFDVFSYQTTEEQIGQYFISIKKILKPEGLFLFEYWNSHGCMATPPEIRVKKFNTSLGNCTRIMMPYVNKSKINIGITCFVETSVGIQKIEETHELRTFTVEEIKSYLRCYGFDMLHNYGWLKTVQATKEDYHGFCVCRRIL